jgi:hypothetical protein
MNCGHLHHKQLTKANNTIAKASSMHVRNMIGNMALESAIVDGGMESVLNRVSTVKGLASKGANQNRKPPRPARLIRRTTPTYRHAFTNLVRFAKNRVSCSLKSMSVPS